MRDTYLERIKVKEDIEKIKKSIERIEKQIDKTDYDTFDVKSKRHSKDGKDELNVLQNKLSIKETILKNLKEELKRLEELQIKSEVEF